MKRRIDADVLEKRLRKEFGEKGKDVIIWIPDETLQYLSKRKLAKLLDKTKTDELEYIKNDRDCDDFAYILMGHIRRTFGSCTFGIIWHNEHAQNIYYDIYKDEVWLVEPQTDKLTKYKDTKVIAVFF